MTTERRKDIRLDTEPLNCQPDIEIKDICLLKNISLQGAFLLCRTPPPVGIWLNLKFTEVPLKDYEVEGIVVRHGLGRFKGFAMYFVNPRPKLLRAVYYNTETNHQYIGF